MPRSSRHEDAPADTVSVVEPARAQEEVRPYFDVGIFGYLIAVAGRAGEGERA